MEHQINSSSDHVLHSRTNSPVRNSLQRSACEVLEQYTRKMAGTPCPGNANGPVRVRLQPQEEVAQILSGIDLPPTNNIGLSDTCAIGEKSFSGSYGSDNVAPLTTCVLQVPKLSV